MKFINKLCTSLHTSRLFIITRVATSQLFSFTDFAFLIEFLKIFTKKSDFYQIVTIFFLLKVDEYNKLE